jgi:uncharacterized protein (DUF58 family)
MMLPSLRFAIAIAAGSLLWVAAAISPGFLGLASLYLACAFVIAAMDILMSPQPHQFEVERIVEEKMNLGTPNRVVLRTRSQAQVKVALRLRDEPPVTWEVVVPEAREMRAGVLLPQVARGTAETVPRRQTDVEYRVTPNRRGVWHFGAISGRYTTRLGLWRRQFRREVQQQVQVYPDMAAVRRYELNLRQGRMREMGLHLARLRGRGSDFESLRDYTTDDNFKDINWKASARRGKLTATNYEVERDQTIVIALDCGRMMTALATHKKERGGEMRSSLAAERATPLSKLDCAINATVLLAHVAAGMGDAVGLLLFADSILAFVPPRKGATQTGAIIEALYAVQPSLVEPDYAGAYNYLLARRIRRSLVVTFTDLIDPDASRELLTASGALRRHHNPLCVTINNRDVMDLAGVMPESSDDLYAKAMAQRMLAQRESALRDLQSRGVGILDVEAARLTVATVNRYLDHKARAAR